MSLKEREGRIAAGELNCGVLFWNHNIYHCRMYEPNSRGQVLSRRSTFGENTDSWSIKRKLQGIPLKKRDLWRVRDLEVWRRGLMGAVEGG